MEQGIDIFQNLWDKIDVLADKYESGCNKHAFSKKQLFVQSH